MSINQAYIDNASPSFSSAVLILSDDSKCLTVPTPMLAKYGAWELNALASASITQIEAHTHIWLGYLSQSI